MDIFNIGIIKTCYKTKFGAPRQSGLVISDRSFIEFGEEFGEHAFEGLKEGCYLWILFLFHQCEGNWKQSVRPPKLGGNKKMGVFATRSPFRPNNIGLSLVKFEKLEHEKGRIKLFFHGADMIDGTPVIDIKPYHQVGDLPKTEFTDLWFDAHTVDVLDVQFTSEAKQFLEDKPQFTSLIKDVLSQDPRPGYHDDNERIYCNVLNDYNVFWKVDGEVATVLDIERIND